MNLNGSEFWEVLLTHVWGYYWNCSSDVEHLTGRASDWRCRQCPGINSHVKTKLSLTLIFFLFFLSCNTYIRTSFWAEWSARGTPPRRVGSWDVAGSTLPCILCSVQRNQTGYNVNIGKKYWFKLEVLWASCEIPPAKIKIRMRVFFQL